MKSLLSFFVLIVLSTLSACGNGGTGTEIHSSSSSSNNSQETEITDDEFFKLDQASCLRYYTVNPDSFYSCVTFDMSIPSTYFSTSDSLKMFLLNRACQKEVYDKVGEEFIYSPTETKKWVKQCPENALYKCEVTESNQLNATYLHAYQPKFVNEIELDCIF